jgi:signal transduction histidine kinase/tetratricopeptide (TPR) repeat protein
MHYVVAAAMMKHYPYDPINQPSVILFEQARHICEGIEAIKLREPTKTAFRELLYQAAETARESGARTSSLYYFKLCLDILPQDPWDDKTGDATYAETLTLHIRATEAFWYAGDYDTASKLLEDVFKHARDATDRAPAAIILSRMYVQKGDSRTAFDGLKRALADLGLTIEDRSLEKCDEEFQSLLPHLQENPPDFTGVDAKKIDRSLTTLAALLTELQSSAYWADHVLYYNATLAILKVYLERGMFAAVALGYVNLAAISVWRFNMVQLGMELGTHARAILDFFDQEYYTIGRVLTLYTLFLGHMQFEFRENFQILNRALEAASTAGDKILHLLNFGIAAAYRLWASENVAETEAYIVSVGDEFPEWRENLRGGVFLMGVQQYSRALAGKTYYKSPSEALNDSNHSSNDYIQFIQTHASNPERPLSIYMTYQLVALYRFGYHQEAMALGERLMPMTDGLLCMRLRYSAMFYLALSIIACIREDPSRADRAELMKRVAHYRAQVEITSAVNEVNYTTYLTLLDAEIADIEQEYADVLTNYEKAVDHALVSNVTLDEALALEHYADWLVRRGAARPARGILLDAISAYRRVGAFGKADHIKDKYEYLLYGTRSLSNVDAGTQTSNDTSTGAPYAYKLERMASQHASQTLADRTVEWLEPTAGQPRGTSSVRDSMNREPPAALSSAAGLDILDLAGILESSQLLSSELDVDRLLSKLTEIIVGSTGAETVGLVVENDQGDWCVASIGTPDDIEAPEMGIPLEEVRDPVARQVTKYVLRFKEEVFLRQVLDDERFSNVPDTWLEQNPDGVSMVSIPILHGENALLGSLYCQAPPNTFTERTVTLLKLLVNQIAISIANALLFKRAERVQASNASMLIVQKQALAQAQEQEKKAKAAEAEAKEMVRLKDEAAKAKSMFLANVSHELRTPLNGVIGMSEMLKSTQLSREQEEHADSIRVCADTLLSVINDILDFSKLEAGKMQVFSVPLRLTETITEVVRALSYTNIERNLVTRTELDLDEKLVVMGDPVRLHQILMNLMSNAYKFTARGCVTVRAKVDQEDDQKITVTTSVQDTGIGISDEQQKKLFLPFSQADSSTARSYGGTGLGLSICKAILENVMKGQIWLESTPKVGTTVSFRLTFHKVDASDVHEHSGTTLHGREAG